MDNYTCRGDLKIPIADLLFQKLEWLAIYNQFQVKHRIKYNQIRLGCKSTAPNNRICKGVGIYWSYTKGIYDIANAQEYIKVCKEIKKSRWKTQNHN